MRRGRTVEIKASSATAWTGSMTTLRFVSQPANCSTLLQPQLLSGGMRYEFTSDNTWVKMVSMTMCCLYRRRWQKHLWSRSACTQDLQCLSCVSSWRLHCSGLCVKLTAMQTAFALTWWGLCSLPMLCLWLASTEQTHHFRYLYV